MEIEEESTASVDAQIVAVETLAPTYNFGRAQDFQTRMTLPFSQQFEEVQSSTLWNYSKSRQIKQLQPSHSFGSQDTAKTTARKKKTKRNQM